MELLDLIFDLGVLFAIYSFIWFFIELGMALLVSGRVRTDEEIYLLRAIKYLFLVNLTFRFSLSQHEDLDVLKLFPSATILIIYFTGKFQRKQKQKAVFKQLGNFSLFRFNERYEMALIALSVLLFILLILFPEYAFNNIANWFDENIKDLSRTIIIGFIFKVVGFFFLLNMIMKMINAFNYILSGKPLIDFRTYVNASKKKGKDDFDDFEEL